MRYTVKKEDLYREPVQELNVFRGTLIRGPQKGPENQRRAKLPSATKTLPN